MRHHRKLLVLFLFGLFFSNRVFAQNNLPRIGEPAPDLSIEQVLSPGEEPFPGLEAFRGKAVILEFWATWCSPCIPAMDHLNELYNNVGSDKLAVIAITDEPESPVKRFLKNKPVDFLVVRDLERRSFEIYQPATIPHSILINPEGKIIAITSPDRIKSEHIEAVLNGEVVELPVKEYGYESTLEEQVVEQIDQKRDAVSLFKTVLRPSDSPSGWMRTVYPVEEAGVNYHDRRITADGAWPTALFSYAFDMPNNRIVDESGLPEQGYYLDIILPEPDPVELKHVLLQTLTTGFGISAEIETRNLEVFQLIKKEGRAFQLFLTEAEEPFYTMRGPTMKARRHPVDTLVDYLNNFTGDRPVIDHTGLEGLYDFSLEWTFSNRESLHDALGKLGLELVKTNESVEVLVIKKAVN